MASEPGPSDGANGVPRRKGIPKGKPTPLPDPAEQCLLCGEPDMNYDNAGYTKIGLTIVIDASRARGVEVHKSFKGLNGVWLHTKCKRQYTRPKSVKRAMNSREGPVLRSHRALTFNVREECVLCGEPADPAHIKKLSRSRRKNTVHRVGTEEDFKKSLEKWMKDRGEHDQVDKDVQQRLNVLPVDFPAAEVRYHKNCYLHVSNGRELQSENTSVGRPAGASEKNKE